MWTIDKNIGVGEKAVYLLLTSAFSFVLFEQSLMTEELWALAGSLKLVLIIISRVPQIWTNYKSKSTGQLAFLTYALAWGGSAGRFVTCLIESSDLVFNLVAISSFSLYSILMMQFLIYWTVKQPVS